MLRDMFVRPRMGRRLVVLVFSVIVIGFCVAVFEQLGVGIDPCAMLNMGISSRIGISFGTCMLLFNAMLMVIILLRKEFRRIGLGTLANMVLVGYSADFMTWLLNRVHPLYGETMLVKMAVFVPTMAVFLVVVAFYMLVDLGVAPYDAIPQMIADGQKKFGFPVIRCMWDVGIILLGMLFGGPLGLVTVVVAFFLGPVVAVVAKPFQRFFE